MPGIEKKDKQWMDMAVAMSKNSKCMRAHYGCIVLNKEGRLIGGGYNGKPAGACNDGVCYREGLEANAEKGGKGEKVCCIHAETNTLFWTPHTDRVGGTLYASGVPCRSCMLNLLNSGLARIVYLDEPATSGHKGDADLEFFKEYGIDIKLVPFSYYEWTYLHALETFKEMQLKRIYAKPH